jgi:hypothetical protein
MKKFLLLVASIFGMSSFSFAVANNVWTSSNTATADTAQVLCSQANTARHGVFHGACVNTGAAGTLTIYNSSSTAVNPIAAINTAAVVPCALFDAGMANGIVYTNSSTANVTLLYTCY